MATKKTSTKRKSSTKSTNYKSAYEVRQKHKKQISAIILFTVGILILALELIPGNGLWTFFKNFLFGCFGFVAFVLPIVLIYIAVMATLDKDIVEIKHKIWQTAIFIALLSGFVELCLKNPFSGETFWDSIANLYINGASFKSGGLFSAIIGWPLLATCGKVGAIIIIALLLFVFIMILTGSTLIGFFRGLAKPVKKLEESYSQRRDEQENKKVAKFDIDVDLGPDPPMPEHPVSAPNPTVEELLELEKQQSIQQNETAKRIKEAKDIIIEISQQQDNQKDINLSVDEQSDQKDDTVLDEKNDSISVKNLYTDENNILNKYVYPPISLLKASINNKNRDVSVELNKNGELLVNTLKSFGVQTKIINISRGPTVTRYELQPSAGVKISRITGLADDIALNLASAGVRIEAPIPNKAAVGIEVPNKNIDVVTMREIIESQEFQTAKSKISMALGKDIAGNSIVADIAKMPHMLIAGATGSGKSVCINSIIMSLLYKASPSEVRFLMVDPKVVELGIYNGIPHLLVPVVTDPRKAAGALGWAVTEMLNRYKLFADNNVRDLTSYNMLAEDRDDMATLPQIVIIIDELADLMMAAPNEVEDAICRLAQMARAAGMHLIIATQRPSVDIITGVIKANIPSRIAFAVSSQVDSRTILDGSGAEKLLGRGDMLFFPVGMAKPMRVQGCFISDKEIESVVNFVKNKEIAEYDDKILEEIEKQAVKEKGSVQSSDTDESDSDELLPNAIECVLEAGQASTSYLQRKLKVGYARAARLIDEMEEKGIIGAFEGSKPRQVLITRQQWIEMKMNNTSEEE